MSNEDGECADVSREYPFHLNFAVHISWLVGDIADLNWLELSRYELVKSYCWYETGFICVDKIVHPLSGNRSISHQDNHDGYKLVFCIRNLCHTAVCHSSYLLLNLLNSWLARNRWVFQIL